MKKKVKIRSIFIIYALLVVVAIITVFRITRNTIQNKASGIAGTADGKVLMNDSRYLELEFDASMEGITGFSFRFEGNRENFGDSAFLVTADIANDLLNPSSLYRGELLLMEQAYDYHNECFKVFIPFDGKVEYGDHLRIAIMGIGMAEKDGISIYTSSRGGADSTVFEVNDFVQDSILTGSVYYQVEGKKIFPVLIQGIVISLLLLLIGEKLQKSANLQKSEETSSSTGKRGFRMPDKKKWIAILPLFFFLFLMLEYTYYAGISTQIEDLMPQAGEKVYTDEETIYRELCDGEAIFSEWRAEGDHFEGLGIYLEEPYDDNGIITLEVSELDSQELVVSVEKAIYEVADEKGLLKFNFDTSIKKTTGKEYVVAIYYSGEPINIRMINDGESNPVLVSLYRRNSFLNILFVILTVLILGFSVIVFLCMQNGVKVERLLFVSMIFLGLLFEMVLTPFTVPDETSHIDTAYRISNEILGVEDAGISDAIYKRESDIYIDDGTKGEIGMKNYRWLYEDWFQTEGKGSKRLDYAGDNRANANSLFYIPAVTGIMIGRILGMGFLPMIYLGRTLTLILCTWLIYLGVKKIPFGKSVLCVIALLPITLQEIASFSYDALIIAISILYVSYCVFAIYSKRALNKSEFLVILISAIMLGACKGGVYTPLYLIGIWAFIKKGYIKFPENRKGEIVAWTILAGVVVIGIVGVVCICMKPIDPYSLRNRFYSIEYLIQHPIETIRIFENTLYQNTYYYFAECIGRDLGLLQISVRFITPIGYLLLIGAAVVCDEKHFYIANTQNKCIFLAAALLSAGAVMLAMLVSYTVFGHQKVEGAQGRYFIPILWPLLISVRRGGIVHKKKQYRKIVIGAYLMGICTVLQVVINALAGV